VLSSSLLDHKWLDTNVQDKPGTLYVKETCRPTTHISTYCYTTAGYGAAGCIVTTRWPIEPMYVTYL
jgi:hypothetical protein